MPEVKRINGRLIQRNDDGSFLDVTPQQQMPVDPKFQYEGPKAQAEVQGAQLRNQGQAITNQITGAEAPFAGQKAQADASKAQAEADKARADLERARMDLEQGKDPEAAVRAAKSILRLLDDVGGIEAQFKDFQGGANPLEYLPTGNMRTFNADAGFLKPASKKLFRAKGEGSQSDAEGRDYDALVPNTWNTDETNRALIDNLRAEAESTLQEYGQPLPNAMTYSRTDGGAGMALGAGASGTQSIPYPPEASAEHDALVQQLIAQGGGRMDPMAYAQGRAAIDQKFDIGAPDVAGYQKWAAGINEYLDQGGATVPTGVTPMQAPLEGFDALRNDVALNPLVSGGIGYADSVSMGGVSALAGDKMAALGAENPLSTTIGQIGGAITGTGMIGKMGKESLGKIVPSFMQQGGKQQFGRDLATDAAYGGIYGGVTEGDPLKGAALAGLGSVGGQAVGKGIGTAIGGTNLSRAAEVLQAKGVPLTGGRRMGEVASRIEDKMASVPFVGDMIGRRQAEGFEAFNRAAFRDAGESIGFQPSAIGGEGVEQFQGAVSRAYDDATAGVSGPFDGQFAQEFENVVGGAQTLPQDVRRGFGEILNARVQPMMDAGTIDGKTYQQAMRALKASRSKPPQRFEGYEQDYRDAVTGTMDALTGQMQRSGGQPVIDGLARANTANKGLKILEDASLDRAKIGTQTGEAEVFLPSQLIAAARKSEKKYGPNVLKQLGKDGQAVLPSTVPNSGTADRGMQAAMGLAGLGAIGGGAETYATGDASTTTKMAAALALLTAGGRKDSQKLIGKVLNTRPEAAKKIGSQIGKRKGLFGSAAVPLLLNPQY